MDKSQLNNNKQRASILTLSFVSNSKHSFDFGNLGYVTNAEISIGQRAVKGWWGKTHRYYDHWCLAEVSPNAQ